MKEQTCKVLKLKWPYFWPVYEMSVRTKQEPWKDRKEEARRPRTSPISDSLVHSGEDCYSDPAIGMRLS